MRVRQVCFSGRVRPFVQVARPVGPFIQDSASHGLPNQGHVGPSSRPGRVEPGPGMPGWLLDKLFLDKDLRLTPMGGARFELATSTV